MKKKALNARVKAIRAIAEITVLAAENAKRIKGRSL